MVPGPGCWPSLATLLHIGADEVLSVLLEHIVDLVKNGVHVLAELLPAFLTSRGTASRLVVSAAALALHLLLGPFASRIELARAKQYPATLTIAATPVRSSPSMACFP